MEGQPIEIAVVDSAAAYRRGLAAALTAAGYVPAEPDDPVAWAKGPAAAGAFVGAPAAERDRTIANLAGPITVVALVPDSDPESWLRSVQAGADGVADRNTNPEDIVTVLEYAQHGWLLLPSEIVRWMVAQSSIPPEVGAPVRPEEAAWLRYLAEGNTVAALAYRVGFSERTMFRRLYEIYGRLEVRNRSEALVAAQRLGLLAEEPADDKPGQDAPL